MDTIGEFLTLIRNAGNAGHEKVDMKSSKVREGLAKVLVTEGFVRSYKVAKDSKQGIMRVYLKYDEAGNHNINDVRRVSRPGRRFYSRTQNIPVIRSGMGMAILSTNQGILSSRQAKELNVGGEVLCTIW